ncbi:YggS family pyridoxal phosphate enzyme [Flexivirga endophytica]|uniref:Pyridoxal phosphate homeostasis protein n=1 Tax=Flexivirga endophytica TaxID=1849103 RepID=A0A916SUG9_9MICO|nr:YggS family pyridoxal phosphate-dependent enzyme [Flexivirga endophytica]GGB18261.1 YggS family pyridoxal phosphate enzyme [Flexivirga endophytica]GHB37369.1 YggS family pyridoxal phosphate enzyme [Flexivirga endophytica]
MSTSYDNERRDQLAANLAAVHDRIDRACTAAGRDRHDVTLIAVTKFFPAADVEHLAALGVTDMGENRDQEAAAKVAELPEDVRGALTVHFIGQLQSNKAAHVARYADVVQSIDRAKIAGALDKAAAAQDRTLDALVQVDLSGATGRGGVAPQDARALADRVAGCAALRLRGVMAVAPLDADPAEAFARLADVADVIRGDHPEATWLSAGMSGDLEQAVAAGATHLRVGSAILGSRPAAR